MDVRQNFELFPCADFPQSHETCGVECDNAGPQCGIIKIIVADKSGRAGAAWLS